MSPSPDFASHNHHDPQDAFDTLSECDGLFHLPSGANSVADGGGGGVGQRTTSGNHTDGIGIAHGQGVAHGARRGAQTDSFAGTFQSKTHFHAQRGMAGEQSGDGRTAGFQKDVGPFLKGFDVFVLTSKTEGLGTSLLDAQAAGIPCVATSAGGIPEIIQHNQNGLLVPPGNPEKLKYLNQLADASAIRDSQVLKEIGIERRTVSSEAE